MLTHGLMAKSSRWRSTEAQGAVVGQVIGRIGHAGVDRVSIEGAQYVEAVAAMQEHARFEALRTRHFG